MSVKKSLEFEIDAPKADSITVKLARLDSIVVKVAKSMAKTEFNIVKVEDAGNALATALEGAFGAVTTVLDEVKERIDNIEDATENAIEPIEKVGNKGAAAIKSFGGAVAKSVVALAAATVALKRMSTESPFFATAMDRINDALSDFALIFGDIIAPIFDVIGEFLIKLVELWESWNGPIKDAVVLGIQIATVLGLVAIGFTILSGAMAVPVAVILIIIAAIVLLKLAWEENFLGIQEIVAKFIEFIQPLLDALGLFMGNVMVDPIDAIMQLFLDLEDFIGNSAQFIRDKLNEFFPFFGDIMIGPFQVSLDIIFGILNTLQPVLEAFGKFVGNFMADPVGGIMELITDLGQFLDDAWANLTNSINDIFPGLGPLIIEPIQNTLDNVIDIVEGFIDTIMGLFDIFKVALGGEGDIIKALEQFFTGISNIIFSVINGVIIDPINFILNALQVAVNLIRDLDIPVLGKLFTGLPDPSGWQLDRIEPGTAEIVTFQRGGFVGGRPFPLVAEEGELILNAAQQRSTAAAITNNSRDQNINVFVTVMGGLGQGASGLGNEISENVTRELQARGSLSL